MSRILTPAAQDRLDNGGYVPPEERQRCGSCWRLSKGANGTAICAKHQAPVSVNGWCDGFKRVRVVAAAERVGQGAVA